MIGIHYNSNQYSRLNKARRALWAAKYMLGAANQEPDKYSKSLWMGVINQRRADLIRVARELRTKLPAKKLHRITLASSVVEFVKFEYAHGYQQAKQDAYETYGDHFAIVSVEEVAHV